MRNRYDQQLHLLKKEMISIGALCETAIARLEADIARLDGEMAQHACDAEKLNELYRQQQDVQKRLEQEMERWEQLSLQAEEQENEV